MHQRPDHPTIGCVLKTPVLWLITGLGSGLSPKAPGTVASLLAAAIYFAVLHQIETPLFICFLVVSAFLGVLLCYDAQRFFARPDHRMIVCDEFVGQWIALLPCNLWALDSSGWWLAAIALFRFFDITKPGPIGYADKHISHAWGVMLDDILAGIASALVLIIVYIAAELFFP